MIPTCLTFLFFFVLRKYVFMYNIQLEFVSFNFFPL